jgi:hypothetical protein
MRRQLIPHSATWKEGDEQLLGFLCRNASLQFFSLFVWVRLRVHAYPSVSPKQRRAENADAANFAFLLGT